MINHKVKNKNVYRDFDLSFNRHPLTNDVAVVIDDRAIEQSLKSLLATNFYERAFDPKIGSNIRKILFEPSDPITMADLRTGIRQTIENYEPRVSILGLVVEDNPDTNSYLISLTYTFAAASSPVTLKVTLERLR
jgi:phage baseplate assembly protein W